MIRSHSVFSLSLSLLAIHGRRAALIHHNIIIADVISSGDAAGGGGGRLKGSKSNKSGRKSIAATWFVEKDYTAFTTTSPR